MRVDLSELEETVRKLRRVSSAMSNTKNDSEYRTDIAPSAIGGGRFKEAAELSQAHDEMKRHINEIIDYLNVVIDDFGTKTQNSHGAYQDAEYEAKNAHGG